jgi:hypothetical protein
MDNSTRRQLLDKARSTGYPGSILEAFTAYDQGRDLIGEFIDQQQQAAMQPPMQVAQTPQEQEQGLRPAHEAGNVEQSMAFPDVQPGQSFNTMGMKVPINIDKVDNSGNLVESYKAVPPGIANLPTGPYEGTVIETPARMQKGGFKIIEPASTTDVKVTPPIDYRSTTRLFEKLDAPEKLRLREELDQIQANPGSVQDYKRGDQIMREIKSRWPQDDSLTMTEDVRMKQLGQQLIQAPLPYDNVTIGKDLQDAAKEAREAKAAQDRYVENLKKKQMGGTKEMPFDLPLKEKNPYLVPEYNQPKANGYILPDPNRPQLMNTGATEYKYSYGTDKGEVQVPSIVSGEYIGDNAYDRYRMSGEEFKPMADPGSYSKFYDMTGELGLMRRKNGGIRKYQTAGEKKENEAANAVYDRMTRSIPTDAYDEFENAYGPTGEYEKAEEMSGMFGSNTGRNSWSYGNQIYDPGTYANWINKKLGREAVMPLQKPWTGPYDVTGRTSPKNLPDIIDTSEPYIDSGIDYRTLTPSNPKNYSPRIADEDMIKTGGLRKQMGGSYQTNQEISMYEWKSGLPEDSRKRYIKGGLKNRVLYNKAKYKR